MKAIILAGGFGTRLAPVVSDVPKAMAPIRGKPFLEYLLKWLRKNSIKDVILSVGYKKEIIKTYFGNGKIKVLSRLFNNNDIDISFSEEEKLLGTGGAVKKAMEEFVIGDDKVFFVLNGDCFSNINLFKMFEEHLIFKQRICTMLATKTPDTYRYGRLSLYDERVIEMQEKGISGSGNINGGIYVFSSSIKKYLKRKCSLENDVFPKLIKDKELFFFNDNDKYFIDIGMPEDYKRLCNEDFSKWKEMIEN